MPIPTNGAYAARYGLTLNQDVAPGATVVVGSAPVGNTWTVTYDTVFMYNPANPTRLTVPATFPPGIWIAEFLVAGIVVVGGAQRFAAIKKNGGTLDLIGHHHRPPSTPVGAELVGGCGPCRLDPGDYVEVHYRQDSSTTETILSTDANTHMSLTWQGAV